MSTIGKILLVVVALALVSFGVAFGVSRYLVERLDGTGGVTAPATDTYRSSELKLSFVYPDTYHVEQQGAAEAPVLVLLPKGYVPPEGGEGPATISVALYPAEGKTLEQWVRTDNRSNFNLSPDEALAPTTVDGQPALSYRHSGLYEHDAVAVLYGGTVYVFAAGWQEEDAATRTELKNILATVEFI